MSVDILQEKIRKMKNPTMLELCTLPSELPVFLLEEGNAAAALERFYRELLTALKGMVPAVRVSFTSFVLMGEEGVSLLSRILKLAKDLGYYVAMDAPELLSGKMASAAAESLFGEKSKFPCDGLIIGAYLGSDGIKPFLPYGKKGKKDLFAAVRTGIKSAPELQDLLCGTRLVHSVAADYVNRYGGDTAGKYGYTQVGILVGATAAESIRTLRVKYPKLFMLLDGYDNPGGNAKKCSYAFDKYGHGAVVSAGSTIAQAWMQAESDGTDFALHAQAAAERMKKNLGRYVSVL